MFSTCVSAIIALLAICTFDFTSPAAVLTKYETTPSRNKSRKFFDTLYSSVSRFYDEKWLKWEKELDARLNQNMIKREFDHYMSFFKLKKHKPENWIERSDSKVRFINNVEGFNKSHLTVVVKNNVMLTSGYNVKGSWTNILKKSVALPQYSVLSAITATLTSDGYLYVDIPIDKNAQESSQEWMVPIVESGKPLDSEPPNMKIFSFLYTDSSQESEQDNSSYDISNADY